MTNIKMKIKISKFEDMGTKPQDYQPMLVVHTHLDNCELCGSALEYSFELNHKDATSSDRSKNLFIGRDCVENFMELYFPFNKEMIKQKLANLVENKKQELFLNDNPDIKNVAKELQTFFNITVRDICTKEKMSDIYYYSFLRSSFYAKVRSDLRSITKKNYLSKPKTKKIYQLQKFVNSGKFMELLIENHEIRTKQIADVREKHKKFYDFYIANLTNVEYALTSRALDVFQRQDYLARYKDQKTIKLEVVKNVY